MSKLIKILAGLAVTAQAHLAAAAPDFPASQELHYTGTAADGQGCTAEVRTDAQARPFGVIVDLVNSSAQPNSVAVGFDYAEVLNGLPITTPSGTGFNISSTRIAPDSVQYFSATFSPGQDQAVTSIEVTSSWVGVVSGTLKCDHLQLMKR